MELVLRCAGAHDTGCMQPRTWAYLFSPLFVWAMWPRKVGETMYANAHSCWKYDATVEVNAYDGASCQASWKGRTKGAVVKELAISAAGSADGRT